MNASKMDLSQMKSLSQEFGMRKYPEIENLFHVVKENQPKNIQIRIVTTCKTFVESYLTQLIGQEVLLSNDSKIDVHINYGDDNYSVCSKYGDIGVDVDGLVSYLSSTEKDKKIAISQSTQVFKNITLSVMQLENYREFDDVSWIGNLMQDDILVLCIDPYHVLFQDELRWIESCILPIFSEKRFYIVVNSVQNVSSTEWGQIVNHITLKLGKEINILPYFTEEISDQRRVKYINNDIDIENIIKQTGKDAVNIRNSHYNDMENFLISSFVNEAKDIRGELQNEYCQSSSLYIEEGKNVEIISDSRKRVEENIGLFIESPTLARFNSDINKFSEDFVSSLSEDIDASTDIKLDSRSMPRYISAIWEQYIQEQNNIEYEIFQTQTQNILDMIWVDLDKLSKNIRSTKIQGNIKEMFSKSFSVNSFFARNAYANNGLTGILTMGGALVAAFVTPVGLVGVLAAELIKVATKDSREAEIKSILKEKVCNIIEQNKKDIVKQAEERFSLVSKEFRQQIKTFYDELETDIAKLVETEQYRMNNSQELISKIDNIISYY